MYQRINFTDHLAIQRFILLNVFFVLVVNNNQESAISDTFPLEAAPPLTPVVRDFNHEVYNAVHHHAELQQNQAVHGWTTDNSTHLKIFIHQTKCNR